MPELPEVETLRRQLSPLLAGTTLLGLHVLDEKLRGLEDPAGKTVLAVSRRGKTLEVHLDDGTILTLHLRMSGRLRWQTEPGWCPHTRFVLVFEGASLLGIDPRRFATLAIRRVPPPCPQIPDPLRSLPAERLMKLASGRLLPVKSFLLDQRFIAGIGNIYACEILHAAGIHPGKPSGSLTKGEWIGIASSAKAILRDAVTCRGTSISDWRDLFGRPGVYQHRLKVYGKAGEACPRCAATVVRIRLGGRGTYFCPACQRLPRQSCSARAI
jgi:formamidopyrimidine-DNA glycosylase